MRDISDMKLSCYCGEALSVAEDQEDMRPGKRTPSKVVFNPCSNVDCITNQVSDEKKHLPRVVWFFDEVDLSYEKVGIKIIDDRPPRLKLWS